MRESMTINLSVLFLATTTLVFVYLYYGLVRDVESSHDEFRLGDKVHKCFVTQELLVKWIQREGL